MNPSLLVVLALGWRKLDASWRFATYHLANNR
jgi:hypothetical protein